MKKSLVRVPHTSVENAILIIRNERVILDTDLAGLYGVENRALIPSVKRIYKASQERKERTSPRVPKWFLFYLAAPGNVFPNPWLVGVIAFL